MAYVPSPIERAKGPIHERGGRQTLEESAETGETRVQGGRNAAIAADLGYEAVRLKG